MAAATSMPKSVSSGLCTTMAAARSRAFSSACGSGRQHDHAEVGIAGRRLLDLSERIPAARCRRRPREHEADVVVLLHEAIRIDDTQRVAHALEGTDLQQDRLVAQHVQAVELQHLLAPRHLAVAVRQRVDRRMDHEARDRERRRRTSAGRRPPRHSAGPRAGARSRPGSAARRDRRGAPTPSAPSLPRLSTTSSGPASCTIDQVRVEPQAARIVGAGVAQAPEHALRDDLLRARQGAAHRARDRVEVGAADRDLPARVDAEVVQDGDEPVQGLHDGPA